MKITKLKKEQINKKLLKSFIKLNNSYSPFLGPLDSIDQTKTLLNMSLYTLVVIDQDIVKGFCVVFKENSDVHQLKTPSTYIEHRIFPKESSLYHLHFLVFHLS